MQVRNVLKFAALSGLVASSCANAAIDVSAATTGIGEITVAVGAVFAAVVAVAAAVKGFVWVVSFVKRG